MAKQITVTPVQSSHIRNLAECIAAMLERTTLQQSDSELMSVWVDSSEGRQWFDVSIRKTRWQPTSPK